MLTNNDFVYLNGEAGQIKSTMIRLASEYGLGYCSTFMITFANIKSGTGRQRLTDITINEYIAQLRGHGFSVENNGQALLVEACVSSMLLAPNDAFQLSNSLEKFRLRATMNGDYENM